MQPLDKTDEIIEQVAAGNSLRSICAQPGFPTIWRFLRRVESDPELAHHYARAMKCRAHQRFESIDSVINDMRSGVIDAQQARVQIDTIKWQAGKEEPQKYGDRTTIAGDPNAPLAVAPVTFEIHLRDGKKGE